MRDAPAISARRRRPGCLIAVGSVALLYVAVQEYRGMQVDAQRALWRARRPQNYSMDVTIVAMAPQPGPNPLTVHGEQGAFADGSECPPRDCPYLPEQLFDAIDRCIWQFPLIPCSADYDPTYGFPTRILHPPCFLVTDCDVGVEIRNFTPLPYLATARRSIL